MEETKYSGKFIKVTEELIGGHIWERVYLSDGVMVYPINSKGEILMIEEQRPHENQPTRLKFVTGLMDKEGEDPLKTANREMQEEIGFKAAKLELILHRESSGTVNNNFYQVVATDLIPSKIPNPDGEETILSITPYSIEQIKVMLENGKLEWSMGVLGVYKIEAMMNKGLIKY